MNYILHLFILSIMMLSNAVAQTDYPSKPIRLITTSAGGTADIITRSFIEELRKQTNWSIFIENRPGGMSTAIASRSKPDGYTIAIGSNYVWIDTLMDPAQGVIENNLMPGSHLTTTYNWLVANKNASFRTVDELINQAKADPDRIMYARGSIGSSSHMAGVLFNDRAGIKLRDIDYKNSTQAYITISGTETNMVMFPPINATVLGLVDAGKVRILAVTSPQRLPILPDTPTLNSYFKGFEIKVILGTFFPKHTPNEVIDLWNKYLKQVANVSGFKEKHAKTYTEIIASSPQEFNKIIAFDRNIWKSIIPNIIEEK